MANLLGLLQTHNRLDRVMALGEQALALAESVGYRTSSAIVHAVLGLTACAVGDFVSARRLVMLAIQAFAEMGDADGVAVYTTSLGQVADREGNLEEAARLLEEAAATAESNGAALYAALAQFDLGGVRLRQGQPGGAISVLEAAVSVFRANDDEEHVARCHTLLGLAYLETGDRERARALAGQAWAAFEASPTSGEDPQYWLHSLWRLMTAIGRSDEAQQALRAAYGYLQGQASRLPDQDVRRRYFYHVAVNRQIVTAYQELAGLPGTITVRLARLGAPQGRPLSDADRIPVELTVNAPEDEAISDKSERRHYRLRRLMAEAAGQGAAPTDDDLARTLGVSRRTVIRDMQALALAGSPAATRHRKG